MMMMQCYNIVCEMLHCASNVQGWQKYVSCTWLCNYHVPTGCNDIWTSSSFIITSV